mmetsp:Transcript_21261/g.29402  ORF Transcript_21261/g.29402 Transcript_21261/m.29402 type:complete len:230 (-) Transcript_21261:253-942(-)
MAHDTRWRRTDRQQQDILEVRQGPRMESMTRHSWKHTGDHRVISAALPVVREVDVEVHLEEKSCEEPAQEGIVRTLLEAEVLAVLQVGHEFCRKAPAKHIWGRVLLDFLDCPMHLGLGGGLLPLPGEFALQEVHQHIPYSLQVVTSALIHAPMGVDAGVPRCANQALAITVRDVLPGPAIPVLLGQAEVDDIDLVRVRPEANQEVVGLNVPVNAALLVHVLDASNHLVC